VEDDVPNFEPVISERDLTRKKFMQRSAVVAGGVIALGTMPGIGGGAIANAAPAGSETYAPAALSTTELTTLKAIINRLIPTDDIGPGAVDSNVHAYIDRELTGYFKALLPFYQQSLAALDKAAGGSFATLSTDKQDALLARGEAGKLGASWAGFFQTVLEHTREGMFGDPMYGGNKNYAGWDLVQYPGVKLVWSATEQAVGTKVKPAHTSTGSFGGHPFE
jgi:hypothetical protein